MNRSVSPMSRQQTVTDVQSVGIICRRCQDRVIGAKCHSASIRRGRRRPGLDRLPRQATFTDGLRNMRVEEAIVKSAATGAAATVPR
jgi:hypothetical protein